MLGNQYDIRYIFFIPAFDPCYEYLTISNEEKRSPFYNFDLNNGIPISDERLTQDWYRIEMNTGSLIPNQSPGAFRCGTFYPIWLNGICLALINQINEINVLLGIKIFFLVVLLRCKV